MTIINKDYASELIESFQPFRRWFMATYCGTSREEKIYMKDIDMILARDDIIIETDEHLLNTVITLRLVYDDKELYIFLDRRKRKNQKNTSDHYFKQKRLAAISYSNDLQCSSNK